ncbi:unnamed protein product [Boreogadus saida]
MNHDMEEKGIVSRMSRDSRCPLPRDHRLGAAHSRRRRSPLWFYSGCFLLQGFYWDQTMGVGQYIPALEIFLGMLGFGFTILFCTAFCRVCQRFRDDQLEREEWLRNREADRPTSVFVIPVQGGHSALGREDYPVRGPPRYSQEVHRPPRYSTTTGPPPAYNEWMGSFTPKNLAALNQILNVKDLAIDWVF